MIFFKVLFLVALGLSFCMYAYIQYDKRIKVRDGEIVFEDKTDVEDVWMEAYSEVLKEALPYS